MCNGVSLKGESEIMFRIRGFLWIRVFKVLTQPFNDASWSVVIPNSVNLCFNGVNLC